MHVCGVKSTSSSDGILARICFFYNTEPLKRTLENIKKQCQCKSSNYGCINPALINIDLDHVLADELHLLLRVTDRMLQNVVDEILEKDAIEDFNKPKGQPKGVLLKKFVDDVNSLGVTFFVWYKKNEDGSRSNVLEYTSLVGAQKKLLLMKHPSMFETTYILLLLQR